MMRRFKQALRMMAVSGLVLLGVSACAGRQPIAPATNEPPADTAAVGSGGEATARAAAVEEQRLKVEADRRQFEIERNRFIYEDIFFARRQYRLDEKALRELAWKADWLLAHPTIKVFIEGHTDEGGSPEDNLALGLRRAGEVQSFFLRRGIARERLSSISYGKERPIATGKGDEVQAKNRRVRTLIIAD